MNNYLKKIFIYQVIIITFLFSTKIIHADELVLNHPIPFCTNASVELKEQLLTIIQKYRVIGMNFLVIKNGNEIGFGCFGYSDLERKIPMKRNTIFRIASMSKPIVAIALLQQVEKKRCRLDDDISQYLKLKVRNPYFKTKPITLRHLLTHTSGICDDGYYYEFLKASYSDAPPSLSSILHQHGIYFSKKSWKKQPPGKKFYYSNLGYGIIATIIEKIAHMRFDEYCKLHIFQPLGILASFNVDDFESVEDFAVLYSHYSPEEKENPAYRNKNEFEPSMDAYRGKQPLKKNLNGWKPGYNAVIHSPQGGARVAITELAKLMIVLMGDGSLNKKVRIVQPSTIREMRKIQWAGKLDNGIHRKTGLGLTITKNLIVGETLYGHSGRAYGFQGMMFFNPLKKYGIIILMNGGDYYKDEKQPQEFHNIELELFRLLHSSYHLSE